ncbi:MAG: sigma-70 family RNA polymerase sigma factor [Verrucomicrobiales bacterium]|nr:sigma-70 family RNA polymerase sigma factor [Verrucomicrobiales bacterium]
MPEEAFATTHWSLVLGARDEADTRAQEAMGRLCQIYWPPLYAWLRRQGYSAPDAEDLVQGFFERFLSLGYLRDVARDKGRFRSFLVASLRHYTLASHRHDRAQRRGKGEVPLVWDEPGVAERCETAWQRLEAPELVYDRVWAETVMSRAAQALRREYETSGNGGLFEGIRRWLAAEARPGEYAVAGPAMGMSEGALAVAVHRLRQRYRRLVRAEVAQTVSNPDEIEGELHHLLKVLMRVGV